ncbi:MAG: radical SAM protein, partial [Candidatus Woesearchaeota archaeon]
MRVLFCAVGSNSLGHITRALTISKRLKELAPELQIRIATDYPNMQLFRVDFCHIGLHLDKIVEPGGMLVPVVTAQLRQVISDYKPYLIVFDTFFALLPEINVKKVLVLRKYRDSELDIFLNNDYCRHFDRVIVPHPKYEFLQDMSDPRFVFVGSIVKNINPELVPQLKKDYGIYGFTVLANCASGAMQQSADFLRLVADVYRKVNHTVSKFIIIKGPCNDDYLEGDNLVVRDFEPNLPELMQACDVVISKAGYNSVNEIISGAVPSILVPVHRDNDDQLERAQRLAAKGASIVFDSFDSEKLAGLVIGLRSSPDRLSQLRANLQNISFQSGNDQAALQILSLCRPKSRLRVGRTCNNNCVFCDLLDMRCDADKDLNAIEQEIDSLAARKKTEVILPCNSDIRPDFQEIIQYAKSAGLNVTLLTNGRMFYYNHFCQKTKPYVDKFCIFLDGGHETHNKITLVDSFSQAVQGARNLVGAEVQLYNVITKHGNLNDSVGLAIELGIKKFRPIFPIAKNEHIPEIADCYGSVDEAVQFAKPSNIEVVTGEVFHNPYIPDDLNLDYDTAELKYSYSPLERKQIIDWEITNSCNYGCWYCGLKNEMADSVHVDGYEKVIEQLKKLPGVWEIIVYGGEPLIVDNISEILSSIIENTRHKIIIVTNLSPSVENLKKILDLPPDRARITASFHSDYVDQDAFFEKAVKVNSFLKVKGIKFEVVSVAIKDRLPKLLDFGRKLQRAGIPFELQPHRHKGCFVDYSEEEQEFIAAQGRTFGLGDMNFKDRLCYAGVDYFVLGENGDCYRCYAAKVLGKNSDSYLGNISDGTFKPWNSPRKCIYERCQCITPYANNLVEREKDVSIVIPSYNRKELLEPALASLFMQDYPRDKYEIVVVDDGSKDNTLDMVKQLKPTCDLKYVYWPRSRPYVFGEAGNRAGPARNLGVMHSAGKNLLFWDSDMVAARDMLNQHMSNYSGASVVLGLRKNLKQIDNKKLLEKLVGNVSFEVLDFGPDTRLGKILAENNYDINGFKNPWFFVMSNNLLLSKWLFDSVGGFDNNFVFWGDEDQELGYRLWQDGIEFGVNTEAIGYHQHHEEESIDTNNFQTTKNLHLSISYKKHLSCTIYSGYMEFRKPHENEMAVPYFVTINPTSLCNLHCPMCSTPTSRQDIELSFEDMKIVVDEVHAIGIKRISFCGGGEPTLHKDFFGILAYAKQKGLVVYLNTNGSFNSGIADRLVKSGIDFVIFSLDFSDPKKHDGFRGMPGLFDCVVSNIERLKNTTKVRIRAV